MFESVEQTQESTRPKVSLSWPTLRGASDEDAYALHLAAHEYSLAASILINDADDIQSAAHWSDRLEPFEHQVRNLITFCRRAPVALIADDVGLGKTISAGLVLSELMTRGRVRKTLVLAPKILLDQWHEELDSKFGIDSCVATGSELDMALRYSDAPVVITTYDSARNRMSRIGERNFDLLILDEAHKLRNLYPGPKPPVVATQLRDALERRQFQFVLMLTATPIQNRLWDLYSLTDLLCVAKGHDHPLGDPHRFVQRYVADGKTRARELVPGRSEEFRRLLAQYMVRTRRADARLHFPSRRVSTRPAPASAVDDALLRVVAREFTRAHPLLQISLGQAVMSSPAALIAQLERMVDNGTAHSSSLHAARDAARLGPPSKLSLLESVIDQLRQAHGRYWRLIVFTIRRETAAFLAAHFESQGHVVGTIVGGRAAANSKSIKSFWADPPDVNLLISTDAGAEGVNLQCCNTLVNYDLPWNPMILEQRIGRIQRLASSHKTVQIINLVVADTVEERVVSRLLQKLQVIAETLGDIEGILEQTADLGGDDSFETMIRKMVAESLQGIDTGESVRRIEESIARAKLLYEEEKEVVDATLSGLDDMHRAGPQLPMLSQSAPSMSEREFSLAAMAQDGYELVEDGNSVLARRGAQRPDHLVFTDSDLAALENAGGYFGAVPARLLKRGRPDFERLVGQWMRQHECLVHTASTAAIDRLVDDWLDGVDADAIGQRSVREGRADFHGEATFRAQAAVALDRYEKIVTLRVGEPSDPSGQDGSETGIDPGSVVAELSTASALSEDQKTRLAGRIAEDQDLSAFSNFYEQRLLEELERTDNPERQKAVVHQFEPALSAELVGLNGVLALERTVSIALTFEPGSFRWEADLTVKPDGSRFVSAPSVGTCGQSGRRIPEALMAPCAISGTRAFKGYLATSEFSGRRALPEYTCRSEVSGKIALRDELTESSISGTRGHPTEFVESAVSGARMLPTEAAASDVSGKIAAPHELERSEKDPTRRGLPDELLTCSVTGQRILLDEGDTSAVSGRFVRKDLLAPSDESGLLALESELVESQLSRKRLLPAEAALCSVSKRTAAKSELVECALTRAYALPEFMGECIEGEPVLISRLLTCAQSGEPVCPTHAVELADDPRTVAKRHAVQCAITGDWILRKDAVQSDRSGALVRATKVRHCELTGATLTVREGTRDRAFGKWVDRRLLDDNGHLDGLSDLLASNTHAKGSAWTDWSSSEHELTSRTEFVGEVQILGYRDVRLLHLRAKRWLGLRTEDFLVLSVRRELDFEPVAVLGPGRVSKGHFTMEGRTLP